MAPARLIALQKPLLVHDLHQLEHRRVTGLVLLLQMLMNLAHRGAADLPETLEDLELGWGWFLEGLSVHKENIRRPSYPVNESLRTSLFPAIYRLVELIRAARGGG